MATVIIIDPDESSADAKFVGESLNRNSGIIVSKYLPTKVLAYYKRKNSNFTLRKFNKIIKVKVSNGTKFCIQDDMTGWRGHGSTPVASCRNA